MKEVDRKRFEKLESWAQSHGARLHPSLEVYHDDVTKFSLRVRESAALLDPGFVAVTCPLSLTLSYLNALADGPFTSASSASETPTFPARFMASVPPHVIGRFFLIHEYLKGTDSFWHPYIAALPRPEQLASWALPAFWPDEDVDFLEATNAAVAIEEIQANVKREFKQARKALKEEGFPDWQDYSRVLYNWAFCIFTSRSFRPSLITSPSAQEEISNALPSGCGIDDFSILQPLFDIPNHSITAKYSWDLTTEPASCQLVCLDGYNPGDQVYNNYGMKTNSELLLGYGFTLPETEQLHNDYVHVRKRQDETGEDKPKDFLISLRPFRHPSSLASRARPESSLHPRLRSLHQFAHFEPALIQDLASSLSTAEERQAIDQLASDGDNLTLDPCIEGLVGRIEDALSAKLQNDLQRLKDVDIAESDDGIVAVNQNQQLALDYRRQCEKVISAALQTLHN
ncbi:ribosomal lysine N-methyltransferase set10 [Podospora aff. communis PSN243]|uniref:Ribosomal lysine N-methyltransferase set10 n=1 Tax=Podospora aff. communis PSN243 TaxID=3040156 RepID=A0AAV9GCS8_9PEZI|nr:ribosomal lysine N-methyltransferase set10 [Podospora aff. communis PSN243]